MDSQVRIADRFYSNLQNAGLGGEANCKSYGTNVDKLRML